MSKCVIVHHFHEIQITKDGEYICEYKENLPHSKEIVKNAVDDWNSTVKPSYLCTGFDDDIANVRAYPSRTDTDAMCVEVSFKPGIRMNKRKRAEIKEAIDAQFSDGWGESFFEKAIIFEDRVTGVCYYAN